MRRKDREMDRAFALSVLDRCEYAVLATVNPDGTPYCIPLTIVRKDDRVYFHCAREGHKLDNIRQNPSVCLTAVAYSHTLEDRFTNEFESAVAFGSAREITDPGEIKEALRLLCERHVPTFMHAFEAEVQKSFDVVAIWEVQLETVTGKRKRYDAQGNELTYGRKE